MEPTINLDLLIDQSKIGFSTTVYPNSQGYNAFYDTDRLLELANISHSIQFNFWQTQTPTVFLGLKDSRLPNLNRGISFLRENNYEVYLRNSGGLAVISDQGILNFSMVIPSNIVELTKEQNYQLMQMVINNTWDLHLTKGIVADSYCPGDFDLSEYNVKVSGLAQRKTATGVLIMAYLSVTGKQQDRGRLLQHFYQLANADDSYPKVNPQSMGNLLQGLSSPEKLISDFTEFWSSKTILSNTNNQLNELSLPRSFSKIKQLQQRLR